MRISFRCMLYEVELEMFINIHFVFHFAFDPANYTHRPSW
jgi:hypothetical protein